MALKGNLIWNAIALDGAVLRIDRDGGIVGGKAGWRAHASLFLNEARANPPTVVEQRQQLAAVQPLIEEGAEKIPDPVYETVDVDVTPAPEPLPAVMVQAAAPYVEGEAPYPALYAALKVAAAEQFPGSKWGDC